MHPYLSWQIDCEFLWIAWKIFPRNVPSHPRRLRFYFPVIRLHVRCRRCFFNGEMQMLCCKWPAHKQRVLPGNSHYPRDVDIQRFLRRSRPFWLVKVSCQKSAKGFSEKLQMSFPEYVLMGNKLYAVHLTQFHRGEAEKEIKDNTKCFYYAINKNLFYSLLKTSQQGPRAFTMHTSIYRVVQDIRHNSLVENSVSWSKLDRVNILISSVSLW